MSATRHSDHTTVHKKDKLLPLPSIDGRSSLVGTLDHLGDMICNSLPQPEQQRRSSREKAAPRSSHVHKFFTEKDFPMSNIYSESAANITKDMCSRLL